MIASTILIFFIFGAIVSFYHVGIEQGFFSESFVCDLDNINDNLSKEQLLKQLKNAPVSCKEVTLSFLTVSCYNKYSYINFLSGMMFRVIKNYG